MTTYNNSCACVRGTSPSCPVSAPPIEISVPIPNSDLAVKVTVRVNFFGACVFVDAPGCANLAGKGTTKSFVFPLQLLTVNNCNSYDID